MIGAPGWIDSAAWKDPFIGHEIVAPVPPTHQHPRFRCVAPHQDEGCSVARPHSAGGRRALGGFEDPDVFKRLFGHGPTLVPRHDGWKGGLVDFDCGWHTGGRY